MLTTNESSEITVSSLPIENMELAKEISRRAEKALAVIPGVKRVSARTAIVIDVDTTVSDDYEVRCAVYEVEKLLYDEYPGAQFDFRVHCDWLGV